MKKTRAKGKRASTTLGVALVLGLIGVSLGGGAFAFHQTLDARGVRLQKKPIYPADRRTLTSLPLSTANWQRVGVDRVEKAEIEEVLGTSNYISRVYVEKNPKPGSDPKAIEFHAAYYTGMIDTVPHVPERCFVGGGLQMSSRTQTLPLPLNSSMWSPDPDTPDDLGDWYRVRTSDLSQRVRLPRKPHDIQLRISEFDTGGDQPLRAGYFFIANGDWVANSEGVRLLAFRLQEEYAYYMKVQFTSRHYESNEAFAEGSAALLDELFGDLMLCVPDWVDVKTGRHPDVLAATEASGTSVRND